MKNQVKSNFESFQFFCCYVLCSRETNVVLMYLKKKIEREMLAFQFFKNYEKSFPRNRFSFRLFIFYFVGLRKTCTIF